MGKKVYGVIGIGIYFWLVISSTGFLVELILADLLKITSISNQIVFVIIEGTKYIVFIILLYWGLNKLEYLIRTKADDLRKIVLQVFIIFVIIQTLQFLYAPIQSKLLLSNREAFDS